MAFELQNPVQDFFQGKAAELPAGYAKLHKTWLAANPNYYVDSITEQVESFRQHVANVVLDQGLALIERMDIQEAQKAELRRLARRSQLVLASKDGKNFDQVLRAEDLKDTITDKLQILSTSLLSQSKDFQDFQEVLDVQVTQHVMQVLKTSGLEFNGTQDVTLKNGRVHIELENNDKYSEVQVDARQGIDKPLDYVHIAHTGDREHVVATQLPEKHGTSKTEPTLEMPTKEEIILSGLSNSDAGRKAALAATQGVQVAAAAAQAMSAANAAQDIERIKALQEAQPFLERGQASAQAPSQGPTADPAHIQDMVKAAAEVEKARARQENENKKRGFRDQAVEEENRRRTLAQNQTQASGPSAAGVGSGNKILASALGVFIGIAAVGGGTALSLIT